MLTRPSPAFKAGVVGNASLNIIGQQNMTALSSVKDLGLLRVNLVIFKASDRILIAIPQRIREFVPTAATRLVLMANWKLECEECWEVTIIR